MSPKVIHCLFVIFFSIMLRVGTVGKQEEFKGKNCMKR